MPSADSIKYCPLLGRKIRRAYCMELGDVRNDDMDIEHIEDRFDIETANRTCEKCGWDKTTIE